MTPSLAASNVGRMPTHREIKDLRRKLAPMALAPVQPDPIPHNCTIWIDEQNTTMNGRLMARARQAKAIRKMLNVNDALKSPAALGELVHRSKVVSPETKLVWAMPDLALLADIAAYPIAPDFLDDTEVKKKPLLVMLSEPVEIATPSHGGGFHIDNWIGFHRDASGARNVFISDDVGRVGRMRISPRQPPMLPKGSLFDSMFFEVLDWLIFNPAYATAYELKGVNEITAAIMRAAGNQPPSPVTIVDLRAPHKQTQRDVAEAERTYRHRWIVRGHWHKYWTGPRGDRTLEPRYVMPYVKGPDGTPLNVTTKVEKFDSIAPALDAVTRGA